MCSFADVITEVEVEPLNGKVNNLMCPIGAISMRSIFTFSPLSSVRIQYIIKTAETDSLYSESII